MTRLLLLQGLLFASRGAAAKFTCADTHEACKVWAKAGECTGNPEYMQVECAVSCGTCERQRARGGAHHDCNEIGDDAHVEGDISQTMARLLATPELRPRVLSRDPWVLQMDTFISEEFAMEVRRVGGHHFEQSLAGYGNGIVSSRTSSTSWCNVPKCEDDEVMVRLKDKIVALLGPEGAPLPLVNTEHLQVLEYEEGEFYKACRSPATAAVASCLRPRLLYRLHLHPRRRCTTTRTRRTMPRTGRACGPSSRTSPT